MPNWCTNNVKISGPAKTLALLVSKIKKHGEIFSATFPPPEELTSVSAGSEELMYHIYYGEIPSYIFGWADVLASGITKEDPDCREKLIDYFSKEGRGFSKEKADQYKHNMDTHGHLTWYSWCVENWGTKWDVSVDDLHNDYLPAARMDEDTYWEFSFETAWSPPEGWVAETSLLYPDLVFTLEYSELGMFFAGFKEYINGELVRGSDGAPDDETSTGRLVYAFCEDDLEMLKEAEREWEKENE
tara:strand:- start:22912 stop:23643 length:732 start_codon:yes stop_codon:yes gene_type:complete